MKSISIPTVALLAMSLCGGAFALQAAESDLNSTNPLAGPTPADSFERTGRPPGDQPGPPPDANGETLHPKPPKGEKGEKGEKGDGSRKERRLIPGVSEADIRKFRAAMREARGDDSVQAVLKNHEPRSPEARSAMREAALKRDPSLGPIMDKMAAHREEMKKQGMAPGGKPRDPATTPPDEEGTPQ